jgi:hypothetical protein
LGKARFELYATLLGDRGEVAQRLAHDAEEVARLGTVFAALRFIEPRQRQQVDDESGQPFGLTRDAFEKPMPRRQRHVRVVEQRLHETLDCGEWRLQFVRHVGHEIAPQRLQAPDAAFVVDRDHVTEARQLAQAHDERTAAVAAAIVHVKVDRHRRILHRGAAQRVERLMQLRPGHEIAQIATAATIGWQRDEFLAGGIAGDDALLFVQHHKPPTSAREARDEPFEFEVAVGQSPLGESAGILRR